MSAIQQAWQTRGAVACLLWPLSLLYRFVVNCRRLAFEQGWTSASVVGGHHDVHQKPDSAVIVVGNISVGGTGKTPLCLHLVKFFQAEGWRPGIVSRGYGGLRHDTPHLLGADDTPAYVGDEPVMLARQSGVPVCVCVKRTLAVKYLATHTDTNIIFSDDGLQHLAMPRVANIVVIDGKRGFGNGWTLPAGPLREPVSRLGQADIIAIQNNDGELHHSVQKNLPTWQADESDGNYFRLQLVEAVSLADGRIVPLTHFANQSVVAMAGIGDPERFFHALRQLGLELTGQALPDHHAYSLQDVLTLPDLPVLVTSKDAVKLRALGELPRDVFEVPAVLSPSASLQQAIARLEARVRHIRGDRIS